MTPSEIIRKRTLELLKQAPDEEVRISKIKEYIGETEPQLTYTQGMMSGALRDLVSQSNGRVTNPSRSHYCYVSDAKKEQMRQVLARAMNDLEALGYDNILHLSGQEITTLRRLPGLIDLLKLGITSLEGEPGAEDGPVQLTLRLDKGRDTFAQIDCELTPDTPEPELEPADNPPPHATELSEARRLLKGKRAYCRDAEWMIDDVIQDWTTGDIIYRMRCIDSYDGFYNIGDERSFRRDDFSLTTAAHSATPEMEATTEKYLGKSLECRGVPYLVKAVEWSRFHECPQLTLEKEDGSIMKLSARKMNLFKIKGD